MAPTITTVPLTEEQLEERRKENEAASNAAVKQAQEQQERDLANGVKGPVDTLASAIHGKLMNGEVQQGTVHPIIKK